MTRSINKYLALLAVFVLPIAANADVVTIETPFNPVQVDGSTDTSTITFGATGTIIDMIVAIDFTKCDNPITDGECIGAGSSFLNEIVFSLTSPLGTVVDLITAGTYTCCGPAGAQVIVYFNDAYATAIGGAGGLVGGDFSPVGSLSDFFGENVFGDWTLTFGDTVGFDPMTMNRWGMQVTTAVPEPGTLALLGLGLVGMAAARRRRTV